MQRLSVAIHRGNVAAVLGTWGERRAGWTQYFIYNLYDISIVILNTYANNNCIGVLHRCYNLLYAPFNIKPMKRFRNRTELRKSSSCRVQSEIERAS